MPKSPSSWTNPSVLRLAGGEDPVAAITRRAQSLAIRAMDEGWSGPPFDPLTLAELLRIPVIARDDIRDARTVPVGSDKVRIEFNPNRPPARFRYSIAHEIAHTLFPDCGDQVRNRASREEIAGDEWQLEALCNIGAAELLIPAGTLPHLRGSALSIDELMERRKEYQVSAEALLIRVAHLADEPCAAFCATRIEEEGRNEGRYRLDYLIPSSRWSGSASRGRLLPSDTRIRECTAIGFTAKGTEVWTDDLGEMYVESVGIPPYPGQRFPRVVGLARSRQASESRGTITYLVGDATQPRGDEPKIIAHVVNDATPRWGGAGFATAVRRRWKHVQEDFIEWVEEDRSRLRLGRVYESEVDETCAVMHMVAQRGYGASSTPRIRYSALRTCLEALTERAVAWKASVHMPRIGTGQAGGSWSLVEELLMSTLCAAGVPVFVYDLPGTSRTPERQITLDFAM